MKVSREIYLSAVAAELSATRNAIASVIRRLGYIPVWHEFSPSDPDDCRPLLARKVRRCKAVIQLIGGTYGPEPPLSRQVGGRTSYAQYEAICAREIDQPVWHFFLESTFADRLPVAEPEELEQLQLTYRRRVESFATFSRSVGSLEELADQVAELRSGLVRVRRRTLLRAFKALFGRLGFHRLGLNGHPPDETSRAQS